MMKLTLAENFRAVFYAPFYAMKALRLAEREGVELDWLPPGSPGGAIDDVKRGAVDLTWGGPMRVIKDHDTAPADGASLVCFGEVVARDPFFLIGAPNAARFDLRALPGLRLGVVSEVPTPWYCLQADLRDAGCDMDLLLASPRLVTGLTMSEQLQALKDGKLDVAQCFEPFASEALAAGATLLHAASGRGPTSYTTLICSRDGLARQHEAFAALNRAVQALLDWIAAHGPVELASITAPFFPDIAPAVYRSSVERYFTGQVWGRSADVTRAGFDRLAYSLHAGRFVSRRMAYTDCVHRFGDAATIAPGSRDRV